MSNAQSLDELVARAGPIIQRSRDASAAHLSRKLGVSWNRAAAVLERLEETGLVSSPDRNGKRNVRTAEGDVIQPAIKQWRPWEAIAAEWIQRFTSWRRRDHG